LQCPFTNTQFNIPKKSRTIRLKPGSDEEDLAETGGEFQIRVPRANTDPAMYSVDCLGEFILNVLSEQSARTPKIYIDNKVYHLSPKKT
jgi:hypothetical protein